MIPGRRPAMSAAIALVASVAVAPLTLAADPGTSSSSSDSLSLTAGVAVVALLGVGALLLLLARRREERAMRDPGPDLSDPANRGVAARLTFGVGASDPTASGRIDPGPLDDPLLAAMRRSRRNRRGRGSGGPDGSPVWVRRLDEQVIPLPSRGNISHAGDEADDPNR
jgi:hypothetical protein